MRRARSRAVHNNASMKPHHTKDKGDLGVLHAKIDLVKKGFGILVPETEHAPFDLVAFRGDQFLRVQVKYRTMVDGRVSVRFESVWADRRGVHKVPMDKSAVDVVCIFCPDTGLCYYVDPLQHRRRVDLRILQPANNQRQDIRWAADFTDLPERFGLDGGEAARPAGLEPATIGLEGRDSSN